MKKYYRLNQYIQASEVRVIDENGKQIGVMALAKALEEARSKSLDLVEVSGSAKPPVCKIIDFKKFRYQEDKKHAEEKKKNKTGGLKEVRLTPFIAQNDFDFRIKRGVEFLTKGFRVRVTVRFLGRQMGKKEFGYEIIKRALKALEIYGKTEGETKFLGRQLEITLVPIKNENKKVVSQKI